MKFKMVLVGCGAAAVLLAVSALAWACTASAVITLGAGAPRGSEVVVNGTGFSPRSAVEVRWNSPEGQVVALATGPQFAISAPVPDVDPGYYYVVAVQREADGRVSAKASEVLEVTGPGGVSVVPSVANGDLWSGLAADGAGNSFSSEAGSGSSTAAIVAGASMLIASLGAGSAALAVAARRRRMRA